ncbi:phytanoyl-CoA dioxygenase family protein [Magnetofaba australis]|uniref:Phytanoyl-CoA dioxygenase n=1 Tax=Magnetofaba australis IT-1 TaxID=1434232 RepID=A0A1Y2JZ30_9PROT|nr:phytanoyl-CoA dioxygenase family protein [Magnetofaba australis]OSM00160.1 hypothetical protein MAIT1_00599 [Magnetofaba australis IT-1]
MWKLRALTALYRHELLWRLRMSIGAWLFRNRPLGDTTLGAVIKQIRDVGAAVIPGYYSEEEMRALETVCEEALSRADTEAKPPQGYRRIPGGIRYQHMQKRHPLAQRFARDPLIVALAAVFNGKFKMPSLMYGVTHDGRRDGASAERPEPFGHHPHTDAWYHMFKALTPMEPIARENGPLCFAPGSNGIQPEASDYYVEMYKVAKREPEVMKKLKQTGVNAGGETYNATGMPDDVFAAAAARFSLAYGEAGRGDLILFDTRCFHYATKLEQGERRILWMYF